MNKFLKNILNSLLSEIESINNRFKHPECKSDLVLSLHNVDCDTCNDIFTVCCSDLDLDIKTKAAIQKKCSYIQNNWIGIMNLYQDEYALGCSAEGHVSHVLEDGVEKVQI